LVKADETKEAFHVQHVGVALPLGRLIAEIAPPIDHLLGRASANAELQTSCQRAVQWGAAFANSFRKEAAGAWR
jgi:hypothetical protein